MTEAQHRLVLAKYLSAIEVCDDLFAEVLAELKAQGLDQNTIVLYVSDHGDMCAEKGIWLKTTFHDAAARKPMILRMPGVLDAGGTIDTLFSEVDILPTLIGLAGMGALLPDLSGQDRSFEVMLAANGVPQSQWADRYGVRPREHAVCVSHLSAWDEEPWAACVFGENLSLTR